MIQYSSLFNDSEIAECTDRSIRRMRLGTSLGIRIMVLNFEFLLNGAAQDGNANTWLEKLFSRHWYIYWKMNAQSKIRHGPR
jgi:hypothetical protein